MVRCIAFLLVLFVVVGCTPGDGGGGPDDGCKSQSDCDSGEICNPGSLRCIKNVSVAEGEYAGVFSVILAQDPQFGLMAGQDQNMLTRAKWNGTEHEINQITTFSADDGKQTIDFGFRSFLDASRDVAFLLSVPYALLDIGKPLPISDQLDPDEGAVGRAFLTYHDTNDPEDSSDDTYELIAETTSGSITFSELSADAGGKIAAEFQGTLMPPTYFSGWIWMRANCTDNQILDSSSFSCSDAYSGYNLMAGLDSRYNGAEFSGGNGMLSYRVAGEEQTYSAGPCWSFETQGMKIIKNMWLTGESGDANREYRLMQVAIPADTQTGVALDVGEEAQVYFFAGVVQPDDSIEWVAVASGQSGKFRIRHFVDGQPGRLLGSLWANVEPIQQGLAEGEDCQVSNDQCAGSMACYPIDSADEGWCFTPCAADGDCDVPRVCESVSFFGEVSHKVCVELLDPFAKGCENREMKLCEGNTWCITNQEEPILDSICIPACDLSSGEGCDANQSCHELGTSDEGGCYKNLPTGADCNQDVVWNGYYCELDDYCVNLQWDDSNTNAVCLASCNPNTGAGCTAGYECQALSDPSLGACYRLLSRGSVCGPDEFLAGESCRSEDICAGDGEGNYLCRMDCTENHNSCPAGETCYELSGGSWACYP